MRRWLGLFAAALSAAELAAATNGPILSIRIDGPIGPATASYIGRALREANQRGADCLIIELDTPGGLLDSTKTIVQDLLASPIPTVVYVSPSGATAASAGCFITLAGDVAAMAPATQIGAAHPVQLAPGGQAQTDSTMNQKMENYAISYIEMIATKRKRNVEWAKASVRESASITAEQALATQVIEIIARDRPHLLEQLEGRELQGRVLRTAGRPVEVVGMSVRERIFQRLWRPEVMFILMLAAMYGIIGELSNPGAILPGVVGVISLILLLYMSAVLPVNVAGLALIGLGLVLFIIDIYAPTHGILTGGGILAFFLGSLMLFDRSDPLLRVSLMLIIPSTLLTAAFFFFVVAAGLRAQRLPVRTGAEAMLGRTANALSSFEGGSGKVLFEGEYWNATSDTPITQGSPVEIVGMTGLTLKVKRKAETTSHAI